MTTAQDQQSRAEFEAHMRKLSPCARLYRHTCDGGDKYRTVTVQRNWELWQAARALPAGMEPVGYMIDWPDEPELGHYFAEKANDGARSQALHTAAQVQAMGRVTPGWQAVPVAPSSEMVQAGVEDLRLRGYKHALIVGAVEVWRAMLAAAPRPPAAQEGA